MSVHSVTFELGSKRKVTRMGFPLVPATAITIHKSHGQTYAQHGADLRGVFCSGQAYIGISRGTGRDGTRIMDVLPRESIYCDVEPLREMERLRGVQPPPVGVMPIAPRRANTAEIVDDPLL